MKTRLNIRTDINIDILMYRNRKYTVLRQISFHDMAKENNKENEKEHKY